MSELAVPSLNLNRGIASWTSGIVLSSEKYSELNVRGRADIAAAPAPYATGTVQIDSRTDWIHEVWLKTPEGREVSFRIPRPDVALRKDQQVGLLALKHPTRREPDPVLLVNKTADRSTWLMTPRTLVYRFGDCSTNSLLISILDAALGCVFAFALALLNRAQHFTDPRLILPVSVLFIVCYCTAQFIRRAMRFRVLKSRAKRWMAVVERWQTP